MMGIWRPFSTRRCTIPGTPLLLLKVLMLPAIPAASVLPAWLALIHGERIDVIHHASITIQAFHIHSLSQHHRSLQFVTVRVSTRYTSRDAAGATDQNEGGEMVSAVKRVGLQYRWRAVSAVANERSASARAGPAARKVHSARLLRTASSRYAAIAFHSPNYYKNNEFRNEEQLCLEFLQTFFC